MTDTHKQHHGGEALKSLNSDDAREILEVSERDGEGGGHSAASPAGTWGSAASDDAGPIEASSPADNPDGVAGGSSGAAANGSYASGTYNGQGDVTGPDSPAGSDVDLDAQGQGQGDDLANRLGGGAGRGTGMTGAGAASGDMRSDGSEPDEPRGAPGAQLGGDAGGPGGMGGVRSRAGSPTGNPPGGVSPIQNDPARRD